MQSHDSAIYHHDWVYALYTTLLCRDVADTAVAPLQRVWGLPGMTAPQRQLCCGDRNFSALYNLMGQSSLTEMSFWGSWLSYVESWPCRTCLALHVCLWPGLTEWLRLWAMMKVLVVEALEQTMRSMLLRQPCPHAVKWTPEVCILPASPTADCENTETHPQGHSVLLWSLRLSSYREEFQRYKPRLDKPWTQSTCGLHDRQGMWVEKLVTPGTGLDFSSWWLTNVGLLSLMGYPGDRC
jgi:hypothetical protein